jgi:hypothetical protein
LSTPNLFAWKFMVFKKTRLSEIYFRLDSFLLKLYLLKRNLVDSLLSTVWFGRHFEKKVAKIRERKKRRKIDIFWPKTSRWRLDEGKYFSFLILHKVKTWIRNIFLCWESNMKFRN